MRNRNLIVTLRKSLKLAGTHNLKATRKTTILAALATLALALTGVVGPA